MLPIKMIRRIVGTMRHDVSVIADSVHEMNPFSSPECSVFSWLTSAAPCFPLKADNLTFLSEPKSFYQNLLSESGKARKRITLASLYIGTGELEKNFIDQIKHNSNFLNGELKVSVLIDYTRGSRGSVNSRTMLTPLIENNQSKCKVYLYKTPSLRSFWKSYLPDRWNELLALQHMKIYIFDDKVFLSGANLSNDYFTNRQDRYLIIEDKEIADFYHGLVEEVQSFSIRVDENNQEHEGEMWSQMSKRDFCVNAGNLIAKYICDTKDIIRDKPADTWLFPLVQMGELGIEQDSSTTTKLLSEMPRNSKIFMATGYFNPTDGYVETLLKDFKGECELLMAHPEANGFLNAKGPAGGIPDAYTLIARHFSHKVHRNQLQDRMYLKEYCRKGWTYHAKGLWYYPENSQLPVLSLIGSPNFGFRSVYRDLETQLVVVTENEELREQLHSECDKLWKYSGNAELDRPIPMWVHVAVYLFKKFF